jgi:hypothetical protein
VWGTALILDLAVEIGAVPALHIGLTLTTLDHLKKAGSSAQQVQPVEIWTTLCVAHIATGTAATESNQAIMGKDCTRGF